MRKILAWPLAGMAAGLVLGTADGAVLLTSARSMFFDASEAWRAAVWCLAICTAAGGIGLTAFGIAAETIIALLPRFGRWGRPPWVSLLVGAVLAGPISFLLWQLTSGPQASQLPGRQVLVAALALIAASVAGYISSAIPFWVSRSERRRPTIVICGALAAAGLTFIDYHILVRLYPIFHAALTILGFATLGVSLRLGIGVPRRTPRIVASSVLLLIAAFLGAWSLHAARSTQNPRFVIGERTSATSDLLTLARWVTPPPPETVLDSAPAQEELKPSRSTGSELIRPQSDVFLITVDAMRHDRLALGGSSRRPAPEIDALAARSIVFSRAYTPIPYTSYALTSMLTGKYTHSLTDVPGAPPVHETWPEIMHRFRYRTAAFFTRAIFFIDRVHFEPYFRSSFGFSYRKVDYRVPAKARADQLLAYLAEDREDERPLFAWTHFFDPHEPYDAACSRFGDRPADRYDCEIATVSRAIGRIIEYLDREHPDAIVIVTSDHGEEFEDHGGKFHGTTLYDEQVRVPLIVRIPGLPHRVVKEPVSLVDLLGTVLSILDIPVPARVRSRNLTGLLSGRGESLDAFAELGTRSMLTTISHKLICDTETEVCRLYDLESDPGERRSCADSQPEMLRKLRARLERWRASHAWVELRPVQDTNGDSSWPPAVRSALAGSSDSVPDLLALLRAEERPTVRRKAAELIRHLWADRPVEALPDLPQETDPEVAAWLALLRADLDSSSSNVLSGLMSQLPHLTKPWRAAALECFDSKDSRSVDNMIAIALHDPAPVAERLEAIALIGESGRRAAVPALIPLIDSYQLTLAAAVALGKLGDRRPVEPLIARLKRERFLERRAVFVESLSAIGDTRAASAIAAELGRDTPTPGSVRALVGLGLATQKGAPLTLGSTGSSAVLFAKPLSAPLVPGLDNAKQVIAVTNAKAEGGTLVISCNGVEVGRLPLRSGSQEPVAELSGCRRSPDAPLAVTLRLEPSDLDADIAAVALIGL